MDVLKESSEGWDSRKMQACLQDAGFPIPVHQEGRGCSVLLIFLHVRSSLQFFSHSGLPGETMGLIVSAWCGLPLG